MKCADAVALASVAMRNGTDEHENAEAGTDGLAGSSIDGMPITNAALSEDGVAGSSGRAGSS